jgi:aryl sulfotransferase
MGGIVWLASYPKSGNTWLRMFFANLLFDGTEPVGINEVGIQNASERRLFDETVGIAASDLRPDEIDRLRPEVYRHLAARTAGTAFLKIHDAYTPTFGTPDRETIRGAIYLIRNPLDVAVSFAHHLGCSIDRAIGYMADGDYAFCQQQDRLHVQLRQPLLSWSQHLQSWVDAPDIPVHPVRYEDMQLRTRETFVALTRFAGLSVDEGQLATALQRCRFSELQRQERTLTFRERPRAEPFFRSGQVGAWREVLTAAQVAGVVEAHAETMRRFGYLDGGGEPQD